MGDSCSDLRLGTRSMACLDCFVRAEIVKARRVCLGWKRWVLVRSAKGQGCTECSDGRRRCRGGVLAQIDVAVKRWRQASSSWPEVWVEQSDNVQRGADTQNHSPFIPLTCNRVRWLRFSYRTTRSTNSEGLHDEEADDQHGRTGSRLQRWQVRVAPRRRREDRHLSSDASRLARKVPLRS